jgi:hypothetical protein
MIRGWITRVRVLIRGGYVGLGGPKGGIRELRRVDKG